MDTADLCYLPALDLRELFAKRELSPVELTTAILDRITAINPSLNSYITITADLALKQARSAEASYAQGDAPPLAGIPFSLKDLTATKGIRTTRGSLLYQDWLPDYDAPLAERLYAAGGVLLGKTNTPEFGWKGDSGNRVCGPTHNPWQHGTTAGGSSGGAAAAVSAGLGPLAQGTDGAGSIRIPACFCGVYGLKPSFGLVPQYPASLVEPFSHAGPITRTVADAALMLNAVRGADPHDKLSWADDTDYLSAMKGDIEGLRVAFSPDLGYAAIEPEVRALVTQAVQRCADLGCHIEEVHPGLPDPWDLVDTVWASAFAGAFDLDEVGDQLDPGLVEVIEASYRYTATQLARAHQNRLEYYNQWRIFMRDYDLFLSPTLPVTAFPAGDHHPATIDGRPTTYLGWTAFTYPFNTTGQPAATVPCGFAANGLPVGMQIVGRHREDATVLRASAAFEAIAPWTARRPALS